MAPQIQAVVHATQAWLQTSRHIQVPFAWLEACVTWLQEEAGGAGRLSQQQVNQQVLDQWLLTDLRDLDHPVLPEGLAQAQKTQLSGTFCVQVDSLLDVSQPAYGQLQKLKGTDCANDEVSAVTQFTQRPWEARPTRMLMLQVTDGVQSLEAMEYQPIPALSADLRPGVKLQLNGQMVCRLGVLLLGPSNIKILGGEVEDLVERNNRGRMLCRTLGLPEEEQQGQEEEGLLPPQQGNQEVEDIELDDAELLASLEAQEEVDMVHAGSVGDSGYRTLTETSIQSSARSSASTPSFISSGGRSAPVHHRHDNQRRAADPSPSDYQMQQEISDHNMDDFPDEDFDDLPLDELDAVIYQEGTSASDSSHRGTTANSHRISANPNRATNAQFEQRASNSSGSQLGFNNHRSTTERRDCRATRGFSGHVAAATSSSFSSPSALDPTPDLDFVANNESEFMDEDLDSFLPEVQTERTVPPAQQGSTSGHRLTSDPSTSAAPGPIDTVKPNPAGQGSAPALTLTSSPFTYLRLLDEAMSRRQHQATEIRVKAFIVTLLGKLSSNNGVWCIRATISDGTGYLDVELSDEVLAGLLGFSVAEKGALKRDPARRCQLNAGMKRCQEELVDMCCIMTIVVEPEGRKAVVTKAEPVSEKVVQELEQRVREGRK